MKKRYTPTGQQVIEAELDRQKQKREDRKFWIYASIFLLAPLVLFIVAVFMLFKTAIEDPVGAIAIIALFAGLAIVEKLTKRK